MEEKADEMEDKPAQDCKHKYDHEVLDPEAKITKRYKTYIVETDNCVITCNDKVMEDESKTEEDSIRSFKSDVMEDKPAQDCKRKYDNEVLDPEAKIPKRSKTYIVESDCKAQTDTDKCGITCNDQVMENRSTTEEDSNRSSKSDEDKPNEEEEATGLDSEEFFLDESTDEDEEASSKDSDLPLEAPSTDEEIAELIDDLLAVESKAAEAQETLEKESLEKIEQEVREELATEYEGDKLENAVADEMATFREEWEKALDELETESAHLLEQLDAAGIDLPSIYKFIEGKAPNGCSTEAWKKRTHWVGSEIAGEAIESIRDAEKQLQAIRPVRRKHGKTLEEGASGYLGKMVAAGDVSAENVEKGWSSFSRLISDQSSKETFSFGGKQWASVYLASTPQQAAALGLNFPGVDEVEEIDDIDDDPSDPFVADALANEKELDLSEEQRKNFRKVKEEDDLTVDQKFQLHLKRKRRKKRSKKNATGNTRSDVYTALELFDAAAKEARYSNGDSSEPLVDLSNKVGQASKSVHEDEMLDPEAKRTRTCILESDSKAPATCNDDMIENQLTAEEGITGSVKVDQASQIMSEKLHCTACGKVTNKAHQHPLMKVILCGLCKYNIETRMKDRDCPECYCVWCGSGDCLVNCTLCRNFFCESCIKRNIGVECSSEAKTYGWHCCCCSPSILQKLTLELDKAIGSQDATSSCSESDSESDNSDDELDVSASSRKSRKKKIRRILDDTELGEETKRKIGLEKERQERLKSLKAQFSGIPMMMNEDSCGGRLPEGASSDILGDALNGFIVNVARENGEDAVRIPPSISAKLKIHQVAGIRFMWENIIQSIRKVKAGDKGLGCILAHTMGLGKTFQVIAFLYTAMRGVDLGLRTALIVTPVNVLHNWRQEFTKWEPAELKPLRVYMLEDKPREQRSELLTKWRKKGGILLIGYTSFRNLALAKNVKTPEASKTCSALQEGPDILVCDEAHMIKNTMAETTQALKQVKCQRRIALTGSPLQNNLMEYYCMVDFVREGFLGSKHEFRNRFQNPIENGQHANSTAEDVRIMNQRSHILYEQLKGFVQRRDMSVVKKDLPPKTVFVIAVRLSSLQRELYKRFLDVHGFTTAKTAFEGEKKTGFFAGYQALAQICNHPWNLQLMKDRENGKQDVAESFLPDACSSDENMDFSVVNGDKGKANPESTSIQSGRTFFHEGWYNELLNQDNHQEMDFSGKMVLLLHILKMSTEVGDKALVFSQSLTTLDLIESYLSKLCRPDKNGKFWKRGKDWYRIDGKTKGSERQKFVDAFNDPNNERVKCTIISTKAGALGINLYAANRVIIVDGAWNPTHDLQAIFRAWRYGQKKPVYAYRLVAHGTIEEKIYKRQVQKEGLAARVVDRQQVHRSMSKEEMLHLFNFDDDESLDNNSSDCPESCSSDEVMQDLLNWHRLRWIMNFHEHETLLQENKEEKLTKEEQDLAWEVYKQSMELQHKQSIEWQEVRRVPADASTFMPTTSAVPAPPAVQAVSLEPETSAFAMEEDSTVPDTEPAASAMEEDDSEPDTVSMIRYRMQGTRCTGTAHCMLLRALGIKGETKIICGGCHRWISWDNLNG